MSASESENLLTAEERLAFLIELRKTARILEKRARNLLNEVAMLRSYPDVEILHQAGVGSTGSNVLHLGGCARRIDAFRNIVGPELIERERTAGDGLLENERRMIMTESNIDTVSEMEKEELRAAAERACGGLPEPLCLKTKDALIERLKELNQLYSRLEEELGDERNFYFVDWINADRMRLMGLREEDGLLLIGDRGRACYVTEGTRAFRVWETLREIQREE